MKWKIRIYDNDVYLNFAFLFLHCLGCGLFPFSDCLLVLDRFIFYIKRSKLQISLALRVFLNLVVLVTRKLFDPIDLNKLWGIQNFQEKKQRIASLHKTVISEMSRKLDKEYFEEQNLVLKLFIHDYAKINWQDQTQTTSKFFRYSSLFKTNQNKVCAILPVLLWKGILGIDES